MRYPVEPAYETIVRQLYAASPGAHAVTTRWTYTVPAGRFAVLEQAFVSVDLSATGALLASVIFVATAAGTELHRVLDVRSLTDRPLSDHAEPHLVLNAGEILRAQTANTDAGVRAFLLSAQLIELPL